MLRHVCRYLTNGRQSILGDGCRTHVALSSFRESSTNANQIETEEIRMETPEQALTPSQKVRQLTQKRLDKLLEEPKYRKAFEQLQTNIEITKYMGWNVPDVIDPGDLLALLQLSKVKQQKFLTVLCKRNTAEQNKKHLTDKTEFVDEPREKFSYYDGEQVYYGLHRNALFLRLYRKTMTQFETYKLMYAKMFEPPIVVDVGYEKYMTYYEKAALAKQISYGFGANRSHDLPFNLHILTENTECDTMFNLNRFLPTMYNEEYLLDIVEKPLEKAYNKNKLIYLTPDSHHSMTKFDHEAIYVIGGIVDKGSSMEYSLAKAKKLQIRTQKLPLHVLHWQTGRKTLTIDQVIQILLDVRQTGDWRYALRHVPRRKLYNRNGKQDPEFFVKN